MAKTKTAAKKTAATGTAPKKAKVKAFENAEFQKRPGVDQMIANQDQAVREYLKEQNDAALAAQEEEEEEEED